MSVCIGAPYTPVHSAFPIPSPHSPRFASALTSIQFLGLGCEGDADFSRGPMKNKSVATDRVLSHCRCLSGFLSRCLILSRWLVLSHRLVLSCWLILRCRRQLPALYSKSIPYLCAHSTCAIGSHVHCTSMCTALAQFELFAPNEHRT